MRLTCFFGVLLFTGLLLPAGSVAQKAEKILRAVVVDSVEKTPLEKCTVTLQGREGQKTVTNDKGVFWFKTTTDTLVVSLEHLGYAAKKQTVVWRHDREAPDTVYLSPADKLMDGIVVKTKVPPIVVRDDTTEYNIDSAMFEPYDVVEDLIKRLPGLEIDEAGKMTFHGKPINRILVDGEDLFGGDPVFSLKKLPAGMVAKIQVMDTKTLEQLFGGLPTDGEEKTLNIKLKAGNKTFGSADALAGTRNQLQGNATLSQFDEGKRISLTGSAESTNKTGLSKARGGPTSSSTDAGVNYGNRWGRVVFNGSYNYNQNGSSNDVYRERTQVLTADTSFFTRSNSRFSNNNNGHRFALSSSWAIDTTGRLDVSLSYAKTGNSGENGASSVTAENGLLRNESINRSLSSGTSDAFSGSLAWAKRFRRPGRSLSVNARLNTNAQSSDLYSQSTNTYFKTGLPVNGDTLDRQTKTESDTRGYTVSLNYAEPVSKTLRLSLNGSFDFNRTFTGRSVYNLDSTTHSATFDSAYSADIVSTARQQNLGLSLFWFNTKWNVNAGFTTIWQQTLRTLQKQELEQRLLRYAPTLGATFRIDKEKILRVNFSATTVQPTVEQLQPVPDNSNPLYIRLGNPNLRTAFSQNYGVSYNVSNAATTVMASLNYAPVSNQIVNAVTYDAYRRMTSQYINVDGIYTARGNVNVTRLLRNEKKLVTLSATSGAMVGRQVYFQSNNRYDSRNASANATLSFSKREQAVRSSSYGLSVGASFARNWTPGDLKVLNTTRLNLSPQVEATVNVFGFVYATASYRLAYNKFDYHSTQRRNNEYSLHQVNNSLRLQVLKKWFIQSTLAYQYNTQVPDGSEKGQVNCDLSATAQLWKQRGQVTFTANDLFANNAALRRVAGENFIEDVQLNNLRNYFTLKVQYMFNRLQKRK